MSLEQRARQAAEGIHRAVGSVRAPSPAASPAPPVRRRGAVAAAVVGTLAVVVAAVAIGHALTGTGHRTATSPVTTRGVILFGQWHPRSQQANWFTIRPDGTGELNLHIFATCATWWPDGSKILITDDSRTHQGFPLRPAIVNPDGSHRRPLVATADPELNLGCGDVSPDDSTIVVEGFNDTHRAVDGVYTIRASDGGGLVRLTLSPPGTSDADPRFAPDGRGVVFLRTKPGIGTEGAGALFVTSIGSGTTRRITPWGSAFPGYNWSPNGQWIAFQRPYGKLYLIRPDGSGLHQVPLRLPDGAGAQNPAWSPDSKSLVFSLRSGNHASLCVVNIDGSGLRQITESLSENQTPDWTK